MQKETTNKLIWWILTLVVGIILSGAGAWAMNQMRVDEKLQEELKSEVMHRYIIERNLALMEEHWKSVDSKLEFLIEKQQKTGCGSGRK